MKDIPIGQWLAFVGPQILLIFQIWKEGRQERMNADRRWTDTQLDISNLRRDFLELNKKLDRVLNK